MVLLLFVTHDFIEIVNNMYFHRRTKLLRITHHEILILTRNKQHLHFSKNVKWIK